MSNFELERQLPFVQVVRPEAVGLLAENYEDTTRSEKEFATIANFRGLLIDIPRDSPSAAAYVDGESRELRFIALSNRESLLITRNPRKLGEAAIRRTTSSRLKPLSDADRDAADRSGLHVIQRYQQNMQDYLHNALEPDMNRMNHMREYAKHRNLSRKKGFGMRSDIAWFRSRIIDETIDAISCQKRAKSDRDDRWNSQDEERAMHALEYRLFFEGSGQKPVDNWEKFLDFELEYWGHKAALFKSKIWQIEKMIREQT